MVKESLLERLRGADRRQLAGLGMVAALLLAGIGFWYVRSLPRPVAVQVAARPGGGGGRSGPGDVASPSPAKVIVVDVAGWVRHPGVFEFHEGDRVIDAIRRAGGARSGADLTSLNLAALLTDAQQIVVVKAGAGGTGAPSGPVSGGTGTSDMVNINTATLDQLETLPGIGPVLAQHILDYRTQHGPFHAVDDLLNVSGIGDSRLADLKPHVTL